MALAEETKRVVSQFEFSDADVNVHVQEFLKQMSKLARDLGVHAASPVSFGRITDLA